MSAGAAEIYRSFKAKPQAIYRVVLSGAFVALTISGCGGGGSSDTITATAQNAPAVTSSADSAELVSSSASKNAFPVANAGSPQAVIAGSTVTLNADISALVNRDMLTYLWTLSKPAASAATLIGTTSPSPTFVADLPGTYSAILVVSDGYLNSAPHAVTVTAGTVVGFDSLSPLPPNMSSYGVQALALASFGDRIALKTGSPRTFNSISIGMSSWACESGTWNSSCLSTPGSVFNHPVTLRIYDSNGNQLATHTQAVDVPYRPSADPACTGSNAGKWKASNGTCYNGFAAQITLNLAALKVTLPDDAFSYDVSYNTNTSGPAPLGRTGPYDSLNIGVYVPPATPSIGSDRDPGFLVRNGLLVNENAGIMAQVEMMAP